MKNAMRKLPQATRAVSKVNRTMSKIKRNSSYTRHEIRAEVKKDGENGKKYIIRGYPIVWDTETILEDYWTSFREKVDRKALDGVSLGEVYLLGDHKPENLLGLTGVNLRLEVDDVGLFMECELVEGDTYAQNIYKRVTKGLLNGMSFGFSLKEDVWEDQTEDIPLRVITKIDKLHEVTLTPFPAYKLACVIAKPDDNTRKESAEDSDDDEYREELDDEDGTDTDEDRDDASDFEELMKKIKEA